MQNNISTKQKTGSRDKIIFIVIIIICLILFFAIRSYIIDKEKSNQDNEHLKKEETKEGATTVEEQKNQGEKAYNTKCKNQNEPSEKTLQQPATQKSKIIKQHKANKNNINPEIKFVNKTENKGETSSQFKTKKYPDSMNFIWKMCLAEVLGLCKDKQNVSFPILGTPGTSIEKINGTNYVLKGYYLYKSHKKGFSIQLISAGNSVIAIQKIKFNNSP
jgi:uncharacterized protein YxeA